jgi:hypothetical protein
MKLAKGALPIFFALCFVFGVAYYLFSSYSPTFIAQVKGAKVLKDKKSYLDTIPTPTGSQEVGRNNREGFSQVTLATQKSSEDVHRFYRSVLVAKGWKPQAGSEDVLTTVYARDQEKIEVAVLSLADSEETVFSISYRD